MTPHLPWWGWAIIILAAIAIALMADPDDHHPRDGES